MFDGNILVW